MMELSKDSQEVQSRTPTRASFEGAADEDVAAALSERLGASASTSSSDSADEKDSVPADVNRPLTRMLR